MNMSVNSVYNELVSKILANINVQIDFENGFYSNLGTISSNNKGAVGTDNTNNATKVAENIGKSDFSKILSSKTTEKDSSSTKNQGVIINDFKKPDLSKMMSMVKIDSKLDPIDKQIDDSVIKASKKYNIDANLIRAVIKQESDFDSKSISHSGAMGLMQLMPENVESLGISDPYNIEQNIDGGANHLREMLDKFNGNEVFALAAYNAGPNAVLRYKGIPPYKETENYVPKVLMYKDKYTLQEHQKKMNILL